MSRHSGFAFVTCWSLPVKRWRSSTARRDVTSTTHGCCSSGSPAWWRSSARLRHEIPKGMQDKYPAIPWADVVGMRNKLIHGYDTVDLDILWDTVTNELPALVEALEKLTDPAASE